MTPERLAVMVVCWVRFYTRGLPGSVAQRRRAEIAADLYDHIAHERAARTSERRIALGILSRMLRGLAADTAWRGRQVRLHAARSSPGRTSLRRSAMRIALGVAAVLALPLAGMLVSGEVTWSAADFALAGALLTLIGAVLELAARRAGTTTAALGVAALGIVACILGEAGDAPGLVLLGILLVVSAIALRVRAAQRGR